jgi:hypothetical protein
MTDWWHINRFKLIDCLETAYTEMNRTRRGVNSEVAAGSIFDA